MTTQQAKTITHINENLEAQRFTAAQASREVAQLDEMSVIIAVQVKIEAGEIAAARQMWLDWKAGRL